MSWDLVVFDCDGVLVDSETISCGILADMLTEAGLPHSLDEAKRRFVGRSLTACTEIIEQLGGTVTPETIAEFERRTFAAFESELRPVPGIEFVLDWLPWPSCVASSGDHKKLRTTLTATGLLPRFAGRIFSTTEVSRGKPAPDLFLYAAGRMGASPERCAVVEDSVPGVEAGLAAGMRVLGFSGTFGAEEISAAGAIVFNRMDELPGLLEQYAPDSAPARRATG